jgi:hypothetical protein
VSYENRKKKIRCTKFLPSLFFSGVAIVIKKTDENQNKKKQMMQQTRQADSTDSTLAHVTNDEWTRLAKEYAMTRACLIARCLYMGENESKGVMVIDDWLVDKKTLLLFQVLDTETGEDVPSLVGRWQTSQNEPWNQYPPELNTLRWNAATFSWNFRAPDVPDEAFLARGIDISKPHAAYLDVPFGHVMNFKDEGRVSPFFDTRWAKLGPIGAKLTKKLLR